MKLQLTLTLEPQSVSPGHPMTLAEFASYLRVFKDDVLALSAHHVSGPGPGKPLMKVTFGKIRRDVSDTLTLGDLVERYPDLDLEVTSTKRGEIQPWWLGGSAGKEKRAPASLSNVPIVNVTLLGKAHRPVVGWLVREISLSSEITAFVIRLTKPTKAILGGKIVAVPIGGEVFLPSHESLGIFRTLLGRGVMHKVVATADDAFATLGWQTALTDETLKREGADGDQDSERMPKGRSFLKNHRDAGQALVALTDADALRRRRRSAAAINGEIAQLGPKSAGAKLGKKWGKRRLETEHAKVLKAGAAHSRDAVADALERMALAAEKKGERPWLLK